MKDRSGCFPLPGHQVSSLRAQGEAQLNGERLHQINAWLMVRRRAKAAGITTKVCNHTFPGTGITAYLENGGTLEKAPDGGACLHPHHAALRPAQGHARSIFGGSRPPP